MEHSRIYFFDNLKALLILAVVFGHTLESLLHIPSARLLYLLLYSFHMPLFAFCSGFFADYRPDRIKRCLLYPFFVFQVLYLLFDRLYLHLNGALTLTRPYWLLWYLFALIFWEILLPFVDTPSRSGKLLFLAFFGTLSILSGYDEAIGYTLSLSRIFVFFPFFLLAFYIKKSGLFKRLLSFLTSLPVRLITLCFLCCLICCFAACQSQFQTIWFYGSVSYTRGSYSGLIRLLLYIAALLWLLFFAAYIPNRPTFLSAIGQNSLSVYLLHGFLIRFLQHISFWDAIPHPVFAAFLLSVFLVLLLAGRPVRTLTAPLLRCPFPPRSAAGPS